MKSLYKKKSANKIVFKVPKRSFTNFEQLLFEQKFEWTKHYKSIVAKVNKYRHTRTKNMHVSNSKPIVVCIFLCIQQFVALHCLIKHKNTIVSSLENQFLKNYQSCLSEYIITKESSNTWLLPLGIWHYFSK